MSNETRPANSDSASRLGNVRQNEQPRRAMIPPRLTKLGHFTEVTTQFAGTFTP
jgi:hypothetical protein